jgi:hypothetical protein
MRYLPLTAASIALFLLAAPALADDGDKGDKGDKGDGGGNLTTPSPEAAIGLPALAAGVAAIVYIRSRRRKAA